MTTKEAIAEISKAQVEGRRIEFADRNGHWSMGARSDGTPWWSYVCCEEDCPSNDFVVCETLHELECMSCGDEWDWIAVSLDKEA